MLLEKNLTLTDLKQQPTVPAMSNDIAGQNTTELERESLVEELKRKNEEMEQFTYTVSHDLKGPLITIKGFLGLLQNDIGESNQENIDSNINQIANAVDEMSNLLCDLLRFSRIGRIANLQMETELKVVVASIVTHFESQLLQSGIVLEVDNNLPILWCDAKRIRDVYFNLIENAIKFASHGTSPKIKIGVQQKQNQTILFIEDNGPGIEPQYHNKVFGLFEKLNSESKGTGIGLAIVKRIVEMHDGKVWIESEGGGRGTRICFTLPQHNIGV